MILKAQEIFWAQVFSMGMIYPVLMNKGKLIIENDEIMFVYSRNGETWRESLNNVKKIGGWFYLHITTKNEKKKIFRVPFGKLNIVKKEIKIGIEKLKDK